ncbi:hypothetical protein TMDG_04054, partial [Mycobacterium tuberculosis SUMu004]
MRQVVRPKTPRGDGNPQLSIADAVQLVRVVRPKTPRGDGKPNLTACWVRRARRESSDPKP